jgi:ankyrin repeat protein
MKKNRIVVLMLVVGPFLAVGSLFVPGAIGMFRMYRAEVPSLHAAAAEGDLQEVRSLIAAGTPVNMQITERSPGYDGQTALMRAALRGHVDVARFLLDSGADPSIRDAKGLTAHDYAETGGCDLVLQLFEQPG